MEIYARIEGTNEEEVLEFYSKLETSMDKIRKECGLIIIIRLEHQNREGSK